VTIHAQHLPRCPPESAGDELSAVGVGAQMSAPMFGEKFAGYVMPALVAIPRLSGSMVVSTPDISGARPGLASYSTTAEAVFISPAPLRPEDLAIRRPA